LNYVTPDWLIFCNFPIHTLRSMLVYKFVILLLMLCILLGNANITPPDNYTDKLASPTRNDRVTNLTDHERPETNAEEHPDVNIQQILDRIENTGEQTLEEAEKGKDEDEEKGKDEEEYKKEDEKEEDEKESEKHENDKGDSTDKNDEETDEDDDEKHDHVPDENKKETFFQEVDRHFDFWYDMFQNLVSKSDPDD
jgi:hypothetical protein